MQINLDRTQTPIAPSPVKTAEGPQSLVGLDREGIAAVLGKVNIPEKQVRMRVSQIWNWVYARGIRDLDEMTNIAKPLRAQLAEHVTLERPEVVTRQVSEDGTRKWLIKLTGGHLVETVFIPESDRGALCVSSQVGCTLNCSFCHTGTMKLVRNLTAAEIVAQIVIARDDLAEWDRQVQPRLLTNIVLMGMGEPLLNYDNVISAMRTALDQDGLDFSKRRITLSTAGIVPKIQQLGEDLGLGLAISLHAVRDELRDILVPINKKWNIEALLEACKGYPVRGRHITFEYVMLKGMNDSDADARELVRLLSDLPAKVNLIPFNPWPGSEYECSSGNRIRAFASILERAGYQSPVRTPRGRDILAACGQLKTATEKQRRSAA